jgi:cytochrome c oxidase subunit 3
MATTLHERRTGASGINSGAGSTASGGWRGLTPADGNLLALQDNSPASRTGIWVGLAAIVMTFAAFTSALVVRQGSAADWRHVDLPSILYLNTLFLLASSSTLEAARRRPPSNHPPPSSDPATLRWLYVTTGLGLAFIGGQYIAWTKLRSEGLYLATNPSSFFYVLTAAHAVHVLGGIGGLVLCIFRLRLRSQHLRRSTLNTVTYYWHFVGILWVYLLALLWFEV